MQLARRESQPFRLEKGENQFLQVCLSMECQANEPAYLSMEWTRKWFEARDGIHHICGINGTMKFYKLNCFNKIDLKDW